MGKSVLIIDDDAGISGHLHVYWRGMTMKLMMS